jgi:menaquinone-dependent protoporphyrinogen oxidase
MKVLVAVASRHNATHDIAEVIADELETAGLDIDLRTVGDVNAVDDYQAVILGSAVYMGRWLPAARDFVETHAAALKTVPVWLFSSGPLGTEDPKPHGDPLDIPELIESTRAREHKVFAGRLDAHSLGLAERLVAKAVHAPEGDFRDLGSVIDWARSIAACLTPVGSS